MFLFVSFIVSSWTEGGAGGSGLESLVLLSNHFFSFCFSTVRLLVGCSVHQEALYHHWASPLAPSAAVLPSVCVVAPWWRGRKVDGLGVTVTEQNIFQAGFSLCLVISVDF